MDDCRPASTSRRPAFQPLVAWGGRALACIVLGQETQAMEAYRRSASLGVSHAELVEVAAMAHLFAGFPRGIQGLHALQEALDGASLPALCSDTEQNPPDARGRALFDRIYGAESNRVLARIDRALPGYAQWILRDAYTRVLTRPGLDAVDRELLAVSALCALDCPAQLRSHVRGARRCGATGPELEHVWGGVEDLLAPAVRQRARAVLDDTRG